MNKNLVEEIKKELEKGKSLESIKISFLTSGYNSKELGQAIKFIKKPKKVEKPKKIKPIKKIPEKPVKITIAKKDKFNAIALIIFVLLFLFSFIMHSKVSKDLIQCRNEISALIKPGVISIFGYVIKEGTRCDSLSLTLLLLKLGVAVTLTASIYLIYHLIKKA